MLEMCRREIRLELGDARAQRDRAVSIAESGHQDRMTAKRIRELGIGFLGALEARICILEATELGQRDAAIAPRLAVPLVQREAGIELGERLGVAAEVEQHRRGVV